MKASLQPAHKVENQSPQMSGMLQRSAVSEAPINVVPPTVYEVLRSPGQSLDTQIRATFELRFGHDFSGVRVHKDARSAEVARALNSDAFTLGRDVVFATGKYAPETRAGQALLAHELTHVVLQQNGIEGEGANLSYVAAENLADRIGEKTIAGYDKLPISGASNFGVARKQASATYPIDARKPFSLNTSIDPSLLSYNELIGEMDLIRNWMASNAGAPELDSLREALKVFERELTVRRKPQSLPKSNQRGNNPEKTLEQLAQDIENATVLPDNPGSYSLRINGQWRIVSANELRRVQDAFHQAIIDGIQKVEIRISGGREGHKNQAKVRSEFPIVSRISDAFGGVSFPSLSIWDEPTNEAAFARVALVGGEMLGVKFKANQYQKATNALVKAESSSIDANRKFHEYWNGTITGAGRAVKTLEFTRDAAFTVNAVLATVATGGAAATAITALAPAAAEIGQQTMEVHLGMRDRIDWGSVTVNFITGLIVGKLAGPVGKKILGPLVNRFGAVGGRIATNLLIGQYSGAFQTLLNTTYEATRNEGKNITFEDYLKLVGDRLTDPKEALANILMGELGHRVQTRSQKKSIKTTEPAGEIPSTKPAKQPEKTTSVQSLEPVGKKVPNKTTPNPAQKTYPDNSMKQTVETKPTKSIKQPQKASTSEKANREPPKGEEVWGELKGELGLSETVSGKARGVSAAVKEAQAVGFMEKTAPGKVDLAVHEHKDAGKIRKALDVSGKDYQSAHDVPTSALKTAKGYSRDKALATLMENEVHNKKFDKHWKDWARNLRKNGVVKIKAGVFYEEMKRSVNNIPNEDLPPRSKGALIDNIRKEMFSDLGLSVDDLVDVPDIR